MALSSCSQPKPEIRYIDKPYIVKIPVKCIVPDTKCDFNRSTYTGVVSAMRECIIDHIHNEKVCK